MSAPRMVPCLAEWIANGPHARYVAERRRVDGGTAKMLRVVRPAGSFPSPPSGDLGLSCVERGSARARLDLGAGAFEEELAPGVLHVARAGSPNAFEASGPHDLFLVTLPWSVVAPVVRDASGGRLSDLGALHRSGHRHGIARDLLQRLWAAGAEDGPASRLFAEGITLALIAELVRLALRQRVPARATPLPAWRLRRAQAILSERLDEAMEMAEVAAAVGLSAYHFARGFKAATGLPPHAWRNQHRIGRVQALLDGSARPIAEIAAECGFCSQAHLTNAFRKATGTTPGAWRRERRV